MVSTTLSTGNHFATAWHSVVKRVSGEPLGFDSEIVDASPTVFCLLVFYGDPVFDVLPLQLACFCCIRFVALTLEGPLASREPHLIRRSESRYSVRANSLAAVCST
jgi:hypothetical protein